MNANEEERRMNANEKGKERASIKGQTDIREQIE